MTLFFIILDNLGKVTDHFTEVRVAGSLYSLVIIKFDSLGDLTRMWHKSSMASSGDPDRTASRWTRVDIRTKAQRTVASFKFRDEWKSYWLCSVSFSQVICMKSNTSCWTGTRIFPACKQCGFRSDGFKRSHLVRIYTVCYSVCEFQTLFLSDNLIGQLSLVGVSDYWISNTIGIR